MFALLLIILADMFVVWLLLNIFSDFNWDDDQRRVLLITLLIAGGGGAINHFLAQYVGLLSLAVYIAFGAVILTQFALVEFRKACAAMGIFLAYKIALSFVIFLVF